METTVNQYEQHLKDKDSAYYSWPHHLINVGCLASDLDMKDDRPEDAILLQKYRQNFVHEYIHFLQNFTTTWGVPLFVNQAFALMRIGASSAVIRSQLNFPLDKESFRRNRSLFQGLDEMDKIVDAIKEGIDERADLTVHAHFIEKDSTDRYVGLSNGKIWCTVSGKVVREHMAHLGTQLYLSRSDEKIHEYHESAREFTIGAIALSKKPEYWIVFEYFYSYSMFQNIAEGLLLLMQCCLEYADPAAAFKRFFEWFKQNDQNSRFSYNEPFSNIVEFWQHLILEVQQRAWDLAEALDKTRYIIQLCNSHLSSNDFLSFAKDIAIYALQNLIKTQGGRLLITRVDQLSDFNFWRRMVGTYGTGLVRYKDQLQIHGTDAHVVKMKDPFTYLFSSIMVIKKLRSGPLQECPFLDEIPICQSSCRGDIYCRDNPFLIGNCGEGACLFRNGVLVLGLENRLEFP